MTKFEKLESAWGILQSKNAIKEMFIQADAKPDEIEKAVERISASFAEHQHDIEAVKLKRLADQIILSEVPLESILDYLGKHRSQFKSQLKSQLKSPPAKSGHKRHVMVMAIVDGKNVYTQGPLPRSLGYKSRLDIPEWLYTDEYKAWLIDHPVVPHSVTPDSQEAHTI